MEKKLAIIQYKTKIKTMHGGRNYINFKVNVSKFDCNLKPHQHAYYNSDMFGSMLRRATLVAQNNKSWCYVDELPESIVIDDSKYMAVVSISINV